MTTTKRDIVRHITNVPYTDRVIFSATMSNFMGYDAINDTYHAFIWGTHQHIRFA